MSVNLVTGYKGEPHITAADMGAFNASIFGAKQYVSETTGGLEATLVNSNTLRIGEGDVMMQGRHIRVTGNNDLTIETGTTGYNRIDLVVMEYSMDTNTSVETASLKVLKGKPTTGTAVAPSYEVGDILQGDMFNQMRLYEVTLTGLNVEVSRLRALDAPSLEWIRPIHGYDWRSGWMYTVYPDGSFNAKVTKDLNFNTGRAWIGGYFHTQVTAVPAPVLDDICLKIGYNVSISTLFLDSAIVASSTLSCVCGSVASVDNGVGVYIFNGSSGTCVNTITFAISGQCDFVKI